MNTIDFKCSTSACTAKDVERVIVRRDLQFPYLVEVTFVTFGSKSSEEEDGMVVRMLIKDWAKLATAVEAINVIEGAGK